MKIVNLTPHAINIISPDDYTSNPAIRKLVAKADVTPIASIPSYKVASATIDTTESEPIDGIPVFDKNITNVEPLPEFDGEECIYIVSALYATAYKRIYPDSDARLYTVADPVYTEDGRTILGSRGICPAF